MKCDAAQRSRTSFPSPLIAMVQKDIYQSCFTLSVCERWLLSEKATSAHRRHEAQNCESGSEETRRLKNIVSIAISMNTQNWHYWHYCQYIPYISLFSLHGISKCEIRCQWVQEDCISRLQISLAYSISNEILLTLLFVQVDCNGVFPPLCSGFNI